MNDPKCKRFYRECDEFSLCVNIGEKGYVLAEHPNERFTIFYYPVYGKGRFGKIFDSNFKIIESGYISDVQDYVNNEVLFHALEDFHLIGFNTFDKNIKWKARLIELDEKELVLDNLNSFLICFDGNPIVNGKKFKRYDYSKITMKKNYKVNLDNKDVLALFSKI